MGALTSGDVISGEFVPVSVTPYRVMSINVTWALSNLGATADDTQEFGVAHSDYSAAEIEECLESTGSLDIGDKIAMERGNRLVRSIGVFMESAGTGAGLSFNGGKPMKTKLNWFIGNGDGINLWIRNGSATVYTTGANVSKLGVMWIKQPA